MSFQFSLTSKRRREGVEQPLIEISDYAIGISLIDFGISEDGGLRSAERQHELFKLRRSLCDGYENKSYHQTGKALDVYAFIDGHASWEPEHLTMVACAMLQAASHLGYKLEWGGLWKPPKVLNGIPRGWDMPHFQLVE